MQSRRLADPANDVIAACPSSPNTDGETPTNYERNHGSSPTEANRKCTCGTATCTYSNYNTYVPDNICNAVLNTCSSWPTCSNTDNSAMLVTPDASILGTHYEFAYNRPQCKCGTRYCRQGDDYPGGSSGPGGKTAAGPAHMYCDAVTSECTLKACDNTDGTVLNSERCQCGKDHCRIADSAKPRATNGYYCNAANHMCGITKEINRFSATMPREKAGSIDGRETRGPLGIGGAEAVNFFTRCHDVSGNVVVMDKEECFEAAAAKGVQFQVVTGSAYPSGCMWSGGGHGTGGSTSPGDGGNPDGSVWFVFNTAPKKFGADETMFSMICKSGTLCQNTDGSATNVDACVCGSVECFSGSTCKSSESLCTLVNQAEKIAEIEAIQKTCCASGNSGGGTSGGGTSGGGTSGGGTSENGDGVDATTTGTTTADSGEKDRISALEADMTTQKTCCTKNAAVEADMTAMKADMTAMKAEMELLKKQYEGIDKVCKTTSSDGERRHLASIGCGDGGVTMSNTNKPDGLSPGAIAAIVIVPIVVLLGCLGGCIMYKQQQKEQIKKTPENLYELKNFTQKRVTTELFDVRGSMNSNNPLTNKTSESDESSTLTMPELSIETDDSSQSFSGTNPMSRNLQKTSNVVVSSSSSSNSNVGVETEEVLKLPLNWEEVSGTDGAAAYFWNNVTNKTQYERPLKVPDLPLNWEEVSGTDGAAAYFWNNVTNETQYKRPLNEKQYT